MNGLGGLNKSPEGVVIGLVQLQLPNVVTKADLAKQTDSFQNLMVTANVCMCGSDGSFDSMGEGMIVNFDGSVLAHGTNGRADEIITAEVRPDLVREARIHWAVENNIYQLGHRGFTAVAGGAQDCPYTYMRDLVAGRYRL